MTRLSLFDQFFLSSEMAGLPPMYMGGASIIDAAESPHELNARAVAEHLAARLEKIPLMRKKIVQDPLRIGNSRLIDDPAFDIRNHITTTVVPKPGGYRELTDCLGAFSAQRLDLTRPPWHFEVIDGLAGGRIAVAMHLHHSVIDGVGATEAMNSMFDLQAVRPERPRKPNWQIGEEPKPFELLSSALRENADRAFIKMPRFVARSSVPVLRLLGSKLFDFLKPGATTKQARTELPKVGRTSLNPAVSSAQRVVSYVEFPMADALAIREHFNCSINDLAMLLNSCALGHYFDAIGETVDFDLVSVMPINVRKEGEKTVGNVLSAGRVNLHNTIGDLPERLRAIVEETARIKSEHHSTDEPVVDSRALMELFSPLVVHGLCYAMARLNLGGRFLFGNVVITNVPGSRAALYIAGAPLVTVIPMAPMPGAGFALTVTVSSTARYLLMGYHGDGAAIRNKELFVEGATQAFAELQRLAGQAAPRTPRATRPNRARATTRTRPAPARSKSQEGKSGSKSPLRRRTIRKR